MSKKSTVVLPQTQQFLNQMGEQIRLARLRRHLSAELVAERAGISRMLRYFQNEGIVKLSRGVVEITDTKKLEEFSDQ